MLRLKRNKRYLTKLIEISSVSQMLWIKSKLGFKAFVDIEEVIRITNSKDIPQACLDLEELILRDYNKPLFEEVEL